jgi:hypothetical protein
MKKNILFILSLVFFIGLFTACSNTKVSRGINVKKQDVREAVWNQFDTKVKKQIKGTWKDGSQMKITLTESMGNINDKTYIGKEVYIINFTTKSISSENNIIVYASIEDYKIIGFGYLG